MVEETIGEAFARHRHLVIGLRQLLQIVMTRQQRVVVVLDQAVL